MSPSLVLRNRRIPATAAMCPVHPDRSAVLPDFGVVSIRENGIQTNGNEGDPFCARISCVLTPDKGWCVFSRFCSRLVGHKLGVYTGRIVGAHATGEYVFYFGSGCVVDARRASVQGPSATAAAPASVAAVPVPPAHWTGLMNHSSNPNCEARQNGVIYQKRQIHYGEELTINYGREYKWNTKKLPDKLLSEAQTKLAGAMEKS